MKSYLLRFIVFVLLQQVAISQSPIVPDLHNWRLLAVSASDNMGDAVIQNALRTGTDYLDKSPIASGTSRTFIMKMPAMTNAGMFTYSIESDITGVAIATYQSNDGVTWTLISANNYNNGRGDDLQKADIPSSVSNKWFKISFNNSSASTKNIKELAMYQFQSTGKNQYFILLGASITESSGGHTEWKNTVTTRLGSTYQPVIFNWSISGAVTDGILSNVDVFLANHPNAGYVFLETAGNDVTANRPLSLAKSKTVSMVQLDKDMRSIVQKIIDAGKVPVFSRISYRNYPFSTSWMGFDQPAVNNGLNQENGSLPFNFMVDKIIKEMTPLFWDANERRGVIDFYQLTFNNPSWIISDGVHFYGSEAYHIRDFWTDYAFKYIYTGQRSPIVQSPEPVPNLASLATNAVVTAEGTKAEQDSWNARVLVEQLASTSLRISLSNRLDQIGSSSTAPKISQQPINMTVAAGGSATFSTIAIGTAPLVYQWQKKGTNIPGATSSSYTYSNVQAADNGATFKCFVSNAVGGIMTSVAVLTVGSNLAPTVSLTSPNNNASFISPANISLAATAADADGSVSMVDFYNGGTLVGSDATSPYTFSWSGVPTGTYSLTAKATDNVGGVSTSTAVSVVVVAPTNVSPVVSLTSPLNNVSFNSPATISLVASASDADGAVSKVDFYNGTTLLGSDATSPYTFSFSSVPSGTYVLTAKATDNLGAVSTSASVTVVVTTPGNSAPTVTITSPLNNASYIAPASFGIEATASDADGSIAKMDFYIGSTSIGTDNWAPFTANVWNQAIGPYTVTAVATDNLGSTGSASIVVNITDASIYFTSSAECFTPNSNISIQLAASKQVNAVRYAWTFSGQGASIVYTFGTGGYAATIKPTSAVTSGMICTGVTYVDNSYREYCKSFNRCANTREDDDSVLPTILLSNASTPSLFYIVPAKEVVSIDILNVTGAVIDRLGSIPSGQSVQFGTGIPNGLHIVHISYVDGTSEIRKIFKVQ